MVLRVFLFILIATQTTPIFGYSLSRMKMSSREYIRYVRPQIRNIIDDFYQFVRYDINSFNEQKKLYRIIDNQMKTSSQMEENCGKDQFSKRCHDDLMDLHSFSISLENNLMKFQKNITLENSQTNCMVLSPLVCMRHMIFLKKLIVNNVSLLTIMDNRRTTSDTYFNKIKDSLLDIKFLVSSNNIYFNELMINPITEDRREDYRDVLINFINQLKIIVMQKNDTDTLMRRLENFNFVFNNFHSKLSKGNLNVSKNELKLLKTMHFRWNSILKIILKNKPEKDRLKSDEEDDI